jgi:hypothetical protein
MENRVQVAGFVVLGKMENIEKRPLGKSVSGFHGAPMAREDGL